MHPLLIGVLVALVFAILGFFYYRHRKAAGCAADSDCPAGQRCAAGFCTPGPPGPPGPPAPTGCYTWSSWNPNVSKNAPPWVTGWPTKLLGHPVAAQDLDGNWVYGVTPYGNTVWETGTLLTPTGDYHTLVTPDYKGNLLWGVELKKDVPGCANGAVFSTTQIPTEGIPGPADGVPPPCWDNSGKTGSFLMPPYTGECPSDVGIGKFTYPSKTPAS